MKNGGGWLALASVAVTAAMTALQEAADDLGVLDRVNWSWVFAGAVVVAVVALIHAKDHPVHRWVRRRLQIAELTYAAVDSVMDHQVWRATIRFRFHGAGRVRITAWGLYHRAAHTPFMVETRRVLPDQVVSLPLLSVPIRGGGTGWGEADGAGPAEGFCAVVVRLRQGWRTQTERFQCVVAPTPDMVRLYFVTESALISGWNPPKD